MKLNNRKVKLKKIVLSEAPVVHLTSEHRRDPMLAAQTNLRPYIQVFLRRKVVFNSVDA